VASSNPGGVKKTLQIGMNQSCVHCGEDCGKAPIIYQDKPFCCNGCKTVYQLLNEKELGSYYKIQPMAGIRIEDDSSDEKYAWLDLEEIKSKLLEFNEGNISKVTFFIPAIHCASCLWLLENLHSLHSGINASLVNFPKKQVAITFRNDLISLRQLVELLASIHYVPEISLKDIDRQKDTRTNRKLILKIGIAGFSFMNTMMYNFPDYLPGGHLLEQEFRDLFGWLSFILSLPVVFYCSSDYFLSAIKGLRYKIINIDLPIALGIVTLFLQSSWEIFSGTGIGFFDSLSGLLFFMLIGKWYQNKTYQALSFERDYQSYFPVAVTLIQIDGSQRSIPLNEVKKGDQLLIRNKEIIPADARIVSGKANIDYSFVSGEAMPVSKEIGEIVFGGGKQMGSSIQIEILKEVQQNLLTQLWNQDQTKHQSVSILTNLINNVSKYFTLIIIFIAISAFAYWFNKDYTIAIYAFTSVLIIACPCALALTIPFTFGNTMRQFGKRGFYLKNTQVIEDLFRADTIVFDKTGTITMSRAYELEFVGTDLIESELSQVRSVVSHSTHPLSKAIFNYLEAVSLVEVEDFKELSGSGLSAIGSGVRINVGSGAFVLGADKPIDNLESRVYVSIGGQYKGYFKFENKYKPGLADVIQSLKVHYDLHLLSGDNEGEKEHLSTLFGSSRQLHFNQSPIDKLNYVRDLKDKGKRVIMIGDGLNDAGALHESHTGITIADDVYQFSPACEAILSGEEFSRLYRYLRFTSRSLQIVRASFVISFLYNLVGLYIAVQGILSPVIAAILMPLSSISVVAFATFAVNLSARKYLK
jgi:P-type Cu+ transporter